MQCDVYRSKEQLDMYVYVEHDSDPEQLPEWLRVTLGRLELAMTIELTPERQLARADPVEIERQIKAHGYYVQKPFIDPAVAD